MKVILLEIDKIITVWAFEIAARPVNCELNESIRLAFLSVVTLEFCYCCYNILCLKMAATVAPTFGFKCKRTDNIFI